MHPLLAYPFDPAVILQKRRQIRRTLRGDGRPRLLRRIAVLGGSTTHDVVEMLELFLLDLDIDPVLFESEYGLFYEDALFGAPEPGGQPPDIVYLHTSRVNIAAFPEPGCTLAQADALLEATFARFCSVWEALHDKYGCAVIQNNFEPPDYRLLGNRDAVEACGQVGFIRRLNERVCAYAREHAWLHVHDIAYLSARVGLDAWLDPQAWYLYKYAMAVKQIPLLAHSLSRIVGSLCGRNKKALALDLDNTLWGGVVGDDGPDGLELGPETPMGQAYEAFQTYIARLRDVGVILSVNSKNDPENALAGLNHPSGVLRPADFACLCANWEPKDQNIVRIADTLNILPGAIVFVDDNPAERALVLAQQPEVAAPALGGPETYIRTLDGCGFFEVTSLSGDDLARSAMYAANTARQQAQAAFADYGAYLASLDMHAVIRPFDAVYIPRITQLTNKSNQFNLTTRRYQQHEIEQAAADGAHITLYGSLTDRFGDNGVVSVIIGRVERDTLHIELWLMSCRVLKRGMERAMLDALAKQAAARGLQTLTGYYIKTAKNGMVRDFYGEMGFAQTARDGDDTVWTLPLPGYAPSNRYIQVTNGEVDEHEPNGDI